MGLLLRINLYVLGASAVGIGLSMMLLGAETTANFFAALIALILTAPDLPQGFSSPDVDSELRFYAVFWIAYGVILTRTASDLAQNLYLVPWLAALFFAGGVGRLLSVWSVGQPHPLFFTLMIIELALSPLLLALWAAEKRVT